MSILQLEEAIRGFINRPRRQASLLADPAAWNTLCSALDVIGDTELALDAYQQWPAELGDGKKYLLIYGALQVMEVQQDALRFICQNLAMSYLAPKELSDIRIIRNQSIGHAMRIKEEKITKSSFIPRIDLDHREFTLFTVYSDRRPYRFQHINMIKLLETQRKFVQRELGKIVEHLEEQEMTHRGRHKTSLLEDIFSDSLGYLVSKICENSPTAGICVREIKGMVNRFRESLKDRGEWIDGNGAAYEVELAEYPIQELIKFFDAGQTSRLNNRDVYIFASFLKMQVEQLREIARQIDREYASSV